MATATQQTCGNRAVCFFESVGTGANNTVNGLSTIFKSHDGIYNISKVAKDIFKILAELLPSEIKGVCQGVATAFDWVIKGYLTWQFISTPKTFLDSLREVIKNAQNPAKWLSFFRGVFLTCYASGSTFKFFAELGGHLKGFFSLPVTTAAGGSIPIFSLVLDSINAVIYSLDIAENAVSIHEQKKVGEKMIQKNDRWEGFQTDQTAVDYKEQKIQEFIDANNFNNDNLEQQAKEEVLHRTKTYIRRHLDDIRGYDELRFAIKKDEENDGLVMQLIERLQTEGRLDPLVRASCTTPLSKLGKKIYAKEALTTPLDDYTQEVAFAALNYQKRVKFLDQRVQAKDKIISAMNGIIGSSCKIIALVVYNIAMPLIGWTGAPQLIRLALSLTGNAFGWDKWILRTFGTSLNQKIFDLFNKSIPKEIEKPDNVPEELLTLHRPVFRLVNVHPAQQPHADDDGDDE